MQKIRLGNKRSPIPRQFAFRLIAYPILMINNRLSVQLDGDNNKHMPDSVTAPSYQVRIPPPFVGYKAFGYSEEIKNETKCVT